MATVWIVDGAYLMKGAPGRFEYAQLKSQLETLNGEPFLGIVLPKLNSKPGDRRTGCISHMDKDRATKGPSHEGSAVQVERHALRMPKLSQQV